MGKKLNQIRKKVRKKPILLIGIILFIILLFTLIGSLFTLNAAFGSSPKLIHIFNQLGLMNLTRIDLNNVDIGILTVTGCESMNLALPQQPIQARFFIDKTLISEFGFSNRCIENNRQIPLITITTEVSLQKSYFISPNIPNLTIESGTQFVEFNKFEIIERVECLVDTDCTSISRLDLGYCNIKHQCEYTETRPPRPPQNFFERIILFLKSIFIIFKR